jgi:hypothetical protein
MASIRLTGGICSPWFYFPGFKVPVDQHSIVLGLQDYRVIRIFA